MANPRDFLPSKYKQYPSVANSGVTANLSNKKIGSMINGVANQATSPIGNGSSMNVSSANSVDPAWSNLAKPASPMVQREHPLDSFPSNRFPSEAIAETKSTPATEPAVSAISATYSPTPSPQKRNKLKNSLAAGLVVALLIAGVAVSASMVQKSQENRPQAAQNFDSCYAECRQTKGNKVCTCQCGGKCERDDGGDGNGSGSVSCSSDQNNNSSTCNSTCSPPKSNGQSFACKWTNGSCGESGQLCNIGTGSGDDKIETVNGVPVFVNLNTQAECSTKASESFWCGGCGGFCLSADYTGGGCISAQMAKCNEGTVYGAACSLSKTAEYAKECACDEKKVYFDREGLCKAGNADNGNEMGLCGVYLNTDPDGAACVGEAEADITCMNKCDTEFGDGESNQGNPRLLQACIDDCEIPPKSDLASCFSCDNNGCKITSTSGSCSSSGAPACWVGHYTCSGTNGNISCEPRSSKLIKSKTTEGASSAGFHNECGTVEQIDVVCDGQYVNSRTKINSDCTNPPVTKPPVTVTTTPSVLKCESITMLNADNTEMIGDDDKNLKPGDVIKFKASAIENNTYIMTPYTTEFRILPPNATDWINLTVTDKTRSGHTSKEYTVISSGPHVAQARICQNNIGCTNWENVN